MAWNEHDIFGLGHQHIKIREVEPDGVTFPEDSRQTVVLTSYMFAPDYGITEGPWIVYRSPYYYMFYSTHLFFCPTYNVRVARSRNVTGPYERSDDYVLLVDRQRLANGTVKFVGTGENHTRAAKDQFDTHSYRSLQCGSNSKRGHVAILPCLGIRKDYEFSAWAPSADG